MATLRIERDPRTGDIVFSGSVTLHDLQRLRLDPIETKMLEEPTNNAADCLLNLELIYRRLGEQYARNNAADWTPVNSGDLTFNINGAKAGQ